MLMLLKLLFMGDCRGKLKPLSKLLVFLNEVSATLLFENNEVDQEHEEVVDKAKGDILHYLNIEFPVILSQNRAC